MARPGATPRPIDRPAGDRSLTEVALVAAAISVLLVLVGVFALCETILVHLPVARATTMVDEGEEKELAEFIVKMEAAQYQLKTGWDMVCAGVREVGDLLECVPPLANGKPDDKSCRLLRSLVTRIIEVEAQ